MAQPLYHRRRNPRYALNRRQGGLQSQSGFFEEKNLLSLSGIEPQIAQPVV
jgi:hypothetical protein